MKHFLMCLLYIAALGVLSFVVGRLIPKHWFHADSLGLPPGRAKTMEAASCSEMAGKDPRYEPHIR